MWLWIAIGALVYWYFTYAAPGVGNVSMDDPISQWAAAIQDFEHWVPGSVSYRNNNPGNLKYAGQPGAVGADANGFAIFPDFETGWNALIAQLNKWVRDYPDYSILQIMTRYLGGNVLNPQVTGEGNPFTYAQAVAGKVGASVTSTLSQVFGGQNG